MYPVSTTPAYPNVVIFSVTIGVDVVYPFLLCLGYQHCIDAFIDESIQYSFYSRNEIFAEIVSLCEKVHKVMCFFLANICLVGKLSKIFMIYDIPVVCRALALTWAIIINGPPCEHIF